MDPKHDHYDYPTVTPTAQSGHPGHTTPEQDAQVHQLRTQLEQEGYTARLDTLTLVRSLTLKVHQNSILRYTAPISASEEIRCCIGQEDVRLY